MKEKLIKVLICLSLFTCLVVQAKDITLRINKRYLNLPVSHQTDRKKMSFAIEGKTERSFCFVWHQVYLIIGSFAICNHI